MIITPRVTDRGLESLKTNMPQLQTFEVANLGKGRNTSLADFLTRHQSWRLMVELVDSKKKLRLQKMFKDS